MKKLHSYTFYALIAPVITLGAGSVLAEQPTGKDRMQSTPTAIQGEQGMQRSQSMMHRGYMDTAPANGTHASKLIGADVKTPKGENVGSVTDLIIDEKGQVVAIVVGVGGFLGMGEKDVAIGWGDVTRSGNADDNELQINATREGLMSAPEFNQPD